MDNKELRRHPPADRQKVKRLLQLSKCRSFTVWRRCPLARESTKTSSKVEQRKQTIGEDHSPDDESGGEEAEMNGAE
jgi:hypothetical protein